jgi:hypothetical protein
MLESEYQSRLIKTLKKKYDGCVVIKTDPSHHVGFPDLLILYNKKWAALECKRNNKSAMSDSQKYHINILNSMSYAARISRENQEEVFDGLSKTFGLRRKTCIPKPK